MPRLTIGIIMNGVTGRMGTNQHLARSIMAIREQGGVALGDGEYSYPTFRHEPIRTDSAGHFNMHTDIPGDGNNRFVAWAYHADWTKDGACGNGARLAQIHY